MKTYFNSCTKPYDSLYHLVGNAWLLYILDFQDIDVYLQVTHFDQITSLFPSIQEAYTKYQYATFSLEGKPHWFAFHQVFSCKSEEV